jgi:hypothetical protein
MKIVNGKWQDDNNNPVDNFNVSQLLELGEKVTNVYGGNITYSRIELVSAIKKLTPKQESDLAYILSQDGLMAKLAGY